MNKVVPLLVGLFLLLAALMLLFFPFSQTGYEHSVLGDKGLTTWLQDNGVKVVHSDARPAPLPEDIALRIAPLPETVYNRDDVPAKKQWAQTYMAPEIFQAKLRELPTLVVLPKWYTHVARNRQATREDRAPFHQFRYGLKRLLQYPPTLERTDSDEAVEERAVLENGVARRIRIKLYYPQVFERRTLGTCRELAGISSGALLVACGQETANHPVYLLSDPDIFANHNLAMAENLEFARAVITMLVETGSLEKNEDGAVYFDKGKLLLSDIPLPPKKRQDAPGDEGLLVLFRYPVSVITAIVLLVAALCYWRGAYRFGAPQRLPAARSQVSKHAAISAMARLMRLSGKERQMVAQFVHGLLLDKAADMFGAAAENQAGIQRLFAHYSRRDQALGSAFRHITDQLTEQNTDMSAHELHRKLGALKDILRRTEQ